jgi:hypothetical protein
MELFKDIVRAFKRFLHSSSGRKVHRSQARQIRRTASSGPRKGGNCSRRKFQGASEILKHQRSSRKTGQQRGAQDLRNREREEAKDQDVLKITKKDTAPVSRKFVHDSKIKAEKGKAERKKPGMLIGEVTHYFARIEVCVIKVIQHHICLEDRVRFLGKATDFIQEVKSLQIETEGVSSAKKGQMVGLKVMRAVNVRDKIYKVT